MPPQLCYTFCWHKRPGSLRSIHQSWFLPLPPIDECYPRPTANRAIIYQEHNNSTAITNIIRLKNGAVNFDVNSWNNNKAHVKSASNVVDKKQDWRFSITIPSTITGQVSWEINNQFTIICDPSPKAIAFSLPQIYRPSAEYQSWKVVLFQSTISLILIDTLHFNSEVSSLNFALINRPSQSDYRNTLRLAEYHYNRLKSNTKSMETFTQRGESSCMEE